MSFFISVLAAAIAFSAYIAIGTVGFSLQFATTNVLNLAFGYIMVLASYVTLTVMNQGIGIWPAAIVGVLAAGAASYLLGRVLLIPAVRRQMSPRATIMLTLGVTLVADGLIAILWSPEPESFGLPATAFVHAGSFTLSTPDFVAIVAAVVLLLATFGLLQLTPLGRAMRAIASNRELAVTSGIPVERVTALSWVISGMLAGVAGILLAAEADTFSAATGFNTTVIIAAAAFLGGIGQMGGAVLGAITVGFVSQFASAYSNPAYVEVYAFGLLVIVLLFRPRGIISELAGQREVAA